MCNRGIYFITTIIINNIKYAPTKPMINQTSKEDRKRQVQNLATMQRKISNTAQMRRWWKQRQQPQDTTLSRQILEGNTSRLSCWGSQHLLFRGSQQERTQWARAARKKWTNSIENPRKLSILEGVNSLRQREHLLLGDRDSTKHQTQGTNTIHQYGNYLLEPTWQKTKGRQI